MRVPWALSSFNVLIRDDACDVVEFGLKLPSKYSFEFVDVDVNMIF